MTIEDLLLKKQELGIPLTNLQKQVYDLILVIKEKYETNLFSIGQIKNSPDHIVHREFYQERLNDLINDYPDIDFNAGIKSSKVR